MSTLQAIPTQHGIDILNSELKNTVTKYRLIGALTHDAPSESLYSFHDDTIETSYYDDNGVLTFILNLPIEQHFDEYLHQIHVLDSSNQSVIECSTPKVALPKGIGGMVTLKAAISGEAGKVIFKHGEFVTETELNDLYLFPLENKLKTLPIYPEVLSNENQIDMTLYGTTLTIADDQLIRLYGWFSVNSSAYDSRSWQVSLAETYHVRFNLIDGFYIKNINDASYNPSSNPETHKQFDTAYDDLLLAKIESGTLLTLVNKSSLTANGMLKELVDITTAFYEAWYQPTIALNWARTPDILGIRVGVWAAGAFGNKPYDPMSILTNDGDKHDGKYGLQNIVAIRNRYELKPVAAFDTNSDQITKTCAVYTDFSLGA